MKNDPPLSTAPVTAAAPTRPAHARIGAHCGRSIAHAKTNTMTRLIRLSTAVLLGMPLPLAAATVEVSDLKLEAFTTLAFAGEAAFRTDSDSVSVPFGDTNGEVEALVRAGGGFLPGGAFPDIPNTVGESFISAAGDARGNFAVGVRGEFGGGFDPPIVLSALATGVLSFTNDTGIDIRPTIDFLIPAPTLRFFNAGRQFTPGAEARDPRASAVARIFTNTRHADGTSDNDLVFEYGLETFRDPFDGEFKAIALGAQAPFPRTDFGFLDFGFQIPELSVDDFALGTVADGDTFSVTLAYTALGSTGFAETALFAAIGDPFNLDAGGGRFELGDVGVGPPPPAPSPVPLPAGPPLLAAGLAALGCARLFRS